MTTTGPDIQVYTEAGNGLVLIGGRRYLVSEEYDGYTFATYTGGYRSHRVYVRAGRAASCTCPDCTYRKRVCRHMHAANQILRQW